VAHQGRSVHPAKAHSTSVTAIERFSVFSHCNDLGGTVWNPAIRWTLKYAVFVQIEDTEGFRGLGECWCFDSTPAALIAFLETEVAPHIVGLPLVDFENVVLQLTQRATLSARHGILGSAISGVDIAMWDLRSRQQGQPLCNFLSNSARAHVPLYASGGLYGQDKDNTMLAAEMTNMVADGFSLVKMKIGALSIDADLERISVVLAALPGNIKLIIDGVYSYTADQAFRLFDSLPHNRIEAFQSPVAASEIAAMAKLVQAGVPVMGTEAEYRIELQRQLIEQNAVRYLQTAAIACGGISRLKELSELVDQAPVKLSLEVSSTAVAFLAAYHFAAANHAVAHVEYHCLHQVFFEDLALARHPDGAGHRVTGDAPGLGITLSPEQVTSEFDARSAPL